MRRFEPPGEFDAAGVNTLSVFCRKATRMRRREPPGEFDAAGVNTWAVLDLNQ